MLSWGARWQLRGSKGLLWTPFPKGGIPSNRVPLCLLRVVWGEWGTVTKCGREVSAS
jgi:hypothetical protein